MNERVRLLRKKLDLTLEVFGNRVGVGKSAISKIERGENNIAEQMILSICREFKVNEEWLRYGTGEMFIAAPSTTLDALAREYGFTHRDYVLVEKFSNLSREERDVVMDFIMEVAAGCSDVSASASALPDDPEGLEGSTEPVHNEKGLG